MPRTSPKLGPLPATGLYGQLTADVFDGQHLPYADNMVNLLVADNLGDVPESEVMRVLCPHGVAYVKQDGAWQKTVKPWPDEIDQWTHFHHDPQGTMVGNDTTVGPPRRIQWLGGPKWLRNHDFMSSMHAMVSAGGRIFYVMDEGLRNHIFLPARWTLIARDGFNGKILWKQPLDDWHPNNWPLKSGPGHFPRKLVAVGDRVYVAAGLTQPVRAFDAATGKIVQHLRRNTADAGDLAERRHPLPAGRSRSAARGLPSRDKHLQRDRACQQRLGLVGRRARADESWPSRPTRATSCGSIRRTWHR